MTEMKAVGILTLGLVGPETLCLEAFLQREKATGAASTLNAGISSTIELYENTRRNATQN